jgi:hypothetical protein
MTTPTQRTKINGLRPSVHKYRVMVADEIIGQFSNIKLATDKARSHRGSVVVDLSTKPPRVAYRDGRLVEKPE